MRPAVRRPELPEQRDVFVERHEWVGLLEDLWDASERAAGSECVEQCLEKPGLRLELVVDGLSRHAGSPRNGVDRESFPLFVVEQLTRGRDDAIAAGLDGSLALDGGVRPAFHGG